MIEWSQIGAACMQRVLWVDEGVSNASIVNGVVMAAYKGRRFWLNFWEISANGEEVQYEMCIYCLWKRQETQKKSHCCVVKLVEYVY
jgi:hypothetical protein